jgi:hypothetical protein
MSTNTYTSLVDDFIETIENEITISKKLGRGVILSSLEYVEHIALQNKSEAQEMLMSAIIKLIASNNIDHILVIIDILLKTNVKLIGNVGLFLMPTIYTIDDQVVKFLSIQLLERAISSQPKIVKSIVTSLRAPSSKIARQKFDALLVLCEL